MVTFLAADVISDYHGAPIQGDVSQTLTSSQLKYECITERRSLCTMSPARATLRKVRSLKHTEIRPSDDISYVIKLSGHICIRSGFMSNIFILH